MRRMWLLAGAAAMAAALMANGKGDARQGRALFERRCTGCHALDTVKGGPPLRKVFGRAAGRDPKFPYSDALKGASVVWDEATLERWLADPEAVVPGNDMALRVGSAAERADLIAYLKELGGK